MFIEPVDLKECFHRTAICAVSLLNLCSQLDLDDYSRLDSPEDSQLSQLSPLPMSPLPPLSQTQLTQADLEEYARTCDDALRPHHQHQGSYAQSEGYHSYVSSSDSTTTAPFLDR